MDNEEKIKELLTDSEFAASLMELETPEEVQSALKAKGVELEIADIEAVRQALLSGSEGELGDDELENVAGGSLTIMAALGIASIIGASVAGGIKLGDAVNKWTRRRW